MKVGGLASWRSGEGSNVPHLVSVPLYITLGFGWVVVNAVMNVRLQLGRDSSVGIVTCYGLECPGIESRWRRDFLHPSRTVLGPLSFLYFRYRLSFFVSKQSLSVALNTHPHLAPRVKKE